jgi:hypothetical protein
LRDGRHLFEHAGRTREGGAATLFLHHYRLGTLVDAARGTPESAGVHAAANAAGPIAASAAPEPSEGQPRSPPGDASGGSGLPVGTVEISGGHGQQLPPPADFEAAAATAATVARKGAPAEAIQEPPRFMDEPLSGAISVASNLRVRGSRGLRVL